MRGHIVVQLAVDIVELVVFWPSNIWRWLFLVFFLINCRSFNLIISGKWVVATVCIWDSTGVFAFVNFTDGTFLKLTFVSSPAFFHHLFLKLIFIEIVTLDLVFILLVHRSIVSTSIKMSRNNWTLELMFGEMVFRLFWLEKRDLAGRFHDWVILDRILFLYHFDFCFDVVFAVGIIADDRLVSSICQALSLFFSLPVRVSWVISLILHARFLFPYKFIMSAFRTHFIPQIAIWNFRFYFTSVQISTVCLFIHVSWSAWWKLVAWDLMQVFLQLEVWIR